MGRITAFLIAAVVGLGVLLSTSGRSGQAQAEDFTLSIGTPGFGLFIGGGHHRYHRPLPWYGYRHRVFHRFGGAHIGPHAAPHLGPHYHWPHGYHFGPHVRPHVNWHGSFGHTGPVLLWGF